MRLFVVTSIASLLLLPSSVAGQGVVSTQQLPGAAPVPNAAPPPSLVVVETGDASAEETAPLAVVSDAAMVASPGVPLVDDFRPGPLGLGASLMLGTRPTNGGIGPTWLGGFDLAYRVDTHVALGIRRAHFGVMGDERYWTMGLSPFVELAMRPWSRLDLYLQLGGALELQVRTRDVSPEGFGIAPFVGGGARFYLSEWFSIALEGAIHVPVVDGISLGDVIAPAGSVYVLGGVALSFHLE